MEFCLGVESIGGEILPAAGKSQHRLNLAKVNIRGEILMSRHEDFDIDNGDASATKVWPANIELAILIATHDETRDRTSRHTCYHLSILRYRGYNESHLCGF